jgi:hypothetical protein
LSTAPFLNAAIARLTTALLLDEDAGIAQALRRTQLGDDAL